MDALFGGQGLVTLDNVVLFNSAVDKLRQPTGVLSTRPADFLSYFNRRLLQLMRDNCAAGRSTWTNNNVEAMNHVLKQRQRNQLIHLIDKIRLLVIGQYADADRALCGRGDDVLRPKWAKHRLTVDCWTSMMAISGRKQSTPAIACLVCHHVQVLTTPGGGKKPHQRKRCHTERTTSLSRTKTVRVASARPQTPGVKPNSDDDFVLTVVNTVLH